MGRGKEIFCLRETIARCASRSSRELSTESLSDSTCLTLYILALSTFNLALLTKQLTILLFYPNL